MLDSGSLSCFEKFGVVLLESIRINKEDFYYFSVEKIMPQTANKLHEGDILVISKTFGFENFRYEGWHLNFCW